MKNLQIIIYAILISCATSCREKLTEMNRDNIERSEIKKILSFEEWSFFSVEILNNKNIKFSDIYAKAGSPKSIEFSADGKCVVVYDYYSKDSSIKECALVFENPDLVKIGYGFNRPSVE